MRAGSRSAAQRMCAIAATKWPQPPSTGLTAALCTGSIRSAALFSAAAMKAADALVVQQCATARVITGGLARLSAGKDARRRHRNLGGAIYRSTSSFHPSFRTDDLQTAYRLTPPTPIYRVDGRGFRALQFASFQYFLKVRYLLLVLKPERSRPARAAS